MHLKALTNCPVCCRIWFGIVLLDFQTTLSLLRHFPACLLEPILSPSNKLLAAGSITVSSHFLLSRIDSLYASCSHSPLQHKIPVLFPWNSTPLSPSVVVIKIECITPDCTKQFEAMDTFCGFYLSLCTFLAAGWQKQ